MYSSYNFLNPGVNSKDEGEDGWIKVKSKRRKEKNSSKIEKRIKVLKHYWNGFDKQGKEKWYISLNNGIIISNNNKEYDFWVKKYYCNNN